MLYYKYHVEAPQLIKFADLIGYAGAAAMMLMYLPQIWETLVLRDKGSLSPITLLLVLPGQVMAVVFQGIINKQKLSTWLPQVSLSLVWRSSFCALALFHHCLRLFYVSVLLIANE